MISSLKQLRGRLQMVLSGENGQTAVTTPRISSTRTSRRPRHPPSSSSSSKSNNNNNTVNTGMDVARLGLVGIVTIPVASWLALFTYGYVYRVEFCKRALTQPPTAAMYPEYGGGGSKPSRMGQQPPPQQQNQQQQWKDVPALLLSKAPPHSTMFLVGSTPSPTSRDVSSLVQDIFNTQNKSNNKQKHGLGGVIYIPFAASSTMVDGSSSITKAFIKAFDLQWLDLRYALVDVLPLFQSLRGEHDLKQALDVVTQALEDSAVSTMVHPSSSSPPRPVIILNGLGLGGTPLVRSTTETDGKMRAVQHVLQWCNTIANERRLAHIVLLGDHELILRFLMDQQQRSNIHVLPGSSKQNLPMSEMSRIIQQEWPDARPQEIQKLIETHGQTWTPDIQESCRTIHHRLVVATPTKDLNDDGNVLPEKRRAQIIDEILSTHFRLQVERVINALERGHTDDEGGMKHEELEPYLDLGYPETGSTSQQQGGRWTKATLTGSLFQACRPKASWSQLQLWRTLQCLVESAETNNGDMSISFDQLRDQIFRGDMEPLLDLMKNGIVSIDVGPTADTECDGSVVSGLDSSWRITPASPTMSRIVASLVQNGPLVKQFQAMEDRNGWRKRLVRNEQAHRQLRLDRDRLDSRKLSLVQTAQLGTALEMDPEHLSQSMKETYNAVIADEIIMEKQYLQLRAERALLVEEASLDKPNEISIHDHLQIALKNICDHEDDRNRKARESFEKHARSKAKGLTALDIIRLIKERTGEEMDVKTAESYIRAWDSNRDKDLDYDEFIEMLLTDAIMMQRKKTSRKKRKPGAEGVRKPTTNSSQDTPGRQLE